MAFLSNIKIKTLSIAGNLLLALAAVGGSLSAYLGATEVVVKLQILESNTVPSLARLSNLST